MDDLGLPLFSETPIYLSMAYSVIHHLGILRNPIECTCISVGLQVPWASHDWLVATTKGSCLLLQVRTCSDCWVQSDKHQKIGRDIVKNSKMKPKCPQKSLICIWSRTLLGSAQCHPLWLYTIDLFFVKINLIHIIPSYRRQIAWQTTSPQFTLMKGLQNITKLERWALTSYKWSVITSLGGGFKYFWEFSPLFEEDFQFD